MLIAHISDTHLGATQYGLEERENDFYNAFKNAIDIIIKEHIDLVIHSGDIFDTPRPSGTAIVKLLSELKRLEENNIKFLFILGEHDISRLKSTPVPFLYEKIKLATHLDSKIININDISITGYNKHRLNEINYLKDNIKNIRTDAKKKILVLHQGLKEAHEFAGEISHLDLPNDFDYYAFGHLHNKYIKYFTDFKGPVCYPGSIEITKFSSDEDLSKGFYIVDLSSNEAKPNWVKLDTRTHMIIDIDNNYDESQLFNKLKDSIKPILKVRFKNIDITKARSILRTLEKYALYMIDEYDKDDYTPRSGSKNMNLDEKMLILAKDILKSEEKARFAIQELLPLLLEDNIEQAVELLWNTCKSKRFG
jgi:DNA repair exonuclease SbcCD nuclease subunit